MSDYKKVENQEGAFSPNELKKVADFLKEKGLVEKQTDRGISFVREEEVETGLNEGGQQEVGRGREAAKNLREKNLEKANQIKIAERRFK